MKDRHLITRGIPGWLIFNEVNTGNKTYEEATNWDADDKPRFLNIENWSGENIDLVINDTIQVPVPAGISLQGLEVKDRIYKVEVTALGQYNIIIRK